MYRNKSKYKSNNTWKSYEEVAQYLLNQFADRFNLGRVEGKQIIPGNSGTEWEIDAKGVKADGEGFLIVECRCHTTSSLNQENVAALAFRIKDTGAQGGIIVSPLDLQRGAKKIAAYTNIQQVTLYSASTTSDYVMRFLNQIFVGMSASITPIGSLHIKKFSNGKIVEERQV